MATPGRPFRDLDAQNVKGVTALALAAQKGRSRALDLLLAAGASVDLANHNGSTALIQASHFGHADVVDRLVRARAHIDTRNNKGTTALMRAAQEGHLSVVSRLLKGRCDVNARNEDGMNALMLGSQRGHAAIVQALIDQRALIDGRTVQGSTALMLSCKRGHVEVVRTLLRAGAELTVKDSKGRVARDQASRRGQEKILALLHPATQMGLMRDVSRAERAWLLRRTFLLVHRGRATLRPGAAAGSPSLTALARAFGYSAGSLAGGGSGGPGGGAGGDGTAAPSTSPSSSSSAWAPGPMLEARPLPLALFAVICDYLPAPRLWRLEVERLERRVRIDAHDAASRGALTVLDEVFTDLLPRYRAPPSPPQPSVWGPALVRPHWRSSEGWLVRIAADPELQRTLAFDTTVESDGGGGGDRGHGPVGSRPMPLRTLAAVLDEQDLQSVLLRYGGGAAITGGGHVSCDAAVAERLVQLARDVHAWSCWREMPGIYPDPARQLLVVPSRSSSSGGGGGGGSAGGGSGPGGRHPCGSGSGSSGRGHGGIGLDVLSALAGHEYLTAVEHSGFDSESDESDM